MVSFLGIILTIYIGFFIFDLVIEILNIRTIGQPLPQIVAKIYDESSYQKAQSYLKDTTIFELINSCFSVAITLCFILFGGFNALDLLSSVSKTYTCFV